MTHSKLPRMTHSELRSFIAKEIELGNLIEIRIWD